MRNTFLFFIAFIFPIKGICQGKEEDFQKYSYLLVLTKKAKSLDTTQYNVIGIATGFFIRKKDKLYLVSANHVFTGNDPVRVKRQDKTADLMVLYYNEYGKEKKSFKNIYLNSIKLSNPPKSLSQYPDILPYQIDLPKTAKIYSIEKFLTNDKINISSKKPLFFWGYPGDPKNLLQSLNYYLTTSQPKKYTGFYKTQDSINYISYPTSGFGNSGAPVFYHTESGEIKFVGILSSASDANNISIIPRYEELIKMIK